MKILDELETWQIAGIALTLMLAGAIPGWALADRRNKRLEKESLFFRTTFPEESSGFKLWVDRKTGVQYLYKGDAMTLYVDAEGKPILYEGNLE